MWKLIGATSTLFVLGVYVGFVVPLEGTTAATVESAPQTFPYLSSVTYTQLPSVGATPTLASATIERPDITDARIAGLLLHVRWLLERKGGTAVDQELNRLNKQILSVMDNVSEDVSDLRDDIEDVEVLPSGFVIDNTGTVTAGVWQGTPILDAYISDVLTIGTGSTFANNILTPNSLLSSGQVDEYCLTYEATGTTFEWELCGGGMGLTATDIDTSSELAAIVGDETGTGALVFGISPTLVTPNLGTPSTLVLTNATGLPITTGLTGAGTGVLTALGVNIGTAGSFVVNGGALGTPASGTLTNVTGLPVSTGIAGLGTGIAAFLTTPSSANLATALTDETGTGALVFAGSPTFTGTVQAAAATLSSTLTMSSSAANIALGSNYLSGDGGDEGIFVDGSGSVGIGTTTPGLNRMLIAGADGVYLRLDANESDSTDGSSVLRMVNDAGYTGEIGMLRSGLSAPYANNMLIRTTTSGSDINFAAGSAITTHMTLKSGGNLGVGTTTPAARLTIQALTGDVLSGWSAAGQVLQLTQSGKVIINSTTANAAAINSTSVSGTYVTLSNTPGAGEGILYGGDWVSGVTSGNKYQVSGSPEFGTNDYFTITNTGSVGIGTTDPQSKLDVRGTVDSEQFRSAQFNLFDDSVPSNGAQVMSIYSDGDAQFDAFTNSMFFNAAQFAFSGGNVGIGTTNPTSKLDVLDGPLSLSVSSGGVGQGGTINFNVAANIQRASIFSGSVTGGQSYLGFSTFNGSSVGERVRINGAGDVGIGTTTPTARLSIQGSAQNLLQLYDAAQGNQMVVEASGTIRHTYLPGGNDSRYVLSSNGTIDFGLPSVGGVLALGNNTTRGYISGNTGALDLFTNGTSTPTMRLATNGNVGIGTTTPSYKLTVAGTTQLIDQVRIGSTFMGNMGNRNEKLAITNFLTDPSVSVYTSRSQSSVGFTTENVGKFNIGYLANASVRETNTANWTMTGYPQLVGISGGADAVSGSSGTIERAAGVYSVLSAASDSATLKQAALFQGDYAGSNMTHVVGMYLSGLSHGTYNTGIYLGIAQDTLTPTSNYAMYDNTGYNSYFSGNVGIGTTTPGARLTVEALTGDVLNAWSASGPVLRLTQSGKLTVNTTTSNILGLTGTSALGTYINLLNTTGAAEGIVYIGNEWISGVTTDDKYQVSGSTAFGTSDYLTITNAGNTGIGTTTPAQRLQVFGNIRVGTTGANGCLEDYGGGVIAGTCSSDEDLKENIEALASSTPRSYLEALTALTPVTYNWNEEAAERYRKNQQVANLGLIAQDVERQFPELVSRNEDGFRQVDFRALPFYIIEAMKELWQKVQGHDERIENLEEENEYLKSRLDEIEDELNVTPLPAQTSEPELGVEPEPGPTQQTEPEPEAPAEGPVEPSL